MIAALRERAVLVLVALAVVGGAGLWRLVSWQVDSSVRGGVVLGGQEERDQQIMFILTWTLTPAATSALVAALIGLPIVIGARYAAVIRSRAAGAGEAPPTPRRPSSGRR